MPLITFFCLSKELFFIKRYQWINVVLNGLVIFYFSALNSNVANISKYNPHKQKL